MPHWLLCGSELLQCLAAALVQVFVQLSAVLAQPVTVLLASQLVKVLEMVPLLVPLLLMPLHSVLAPGENHGLHVALLVVVPELVALVLLTVKALVLVMMMVLVIIT